METSGRRRYKLNAVRYLRGPLLQQELLLRVAPAPSETSPALRRSVWFEKSYF